MKGVKRMNLKKEYQKLKEKYIAQIDINFRLAKDIEEINEKYKKNIYYLNCLRDKYKALEETNDDLNKRLAAEIMKNVERS